MQLNGTNKCNTSYIIVDHVQTFFLNILLLCQCPKEVFEKIQYRVSTNIMSDSISTYYLLNAVLSYYCINIY